MIEQLLPGFPRLYLAANPTPAVSTATVTRHPLLAMPGSPALQRADVFARTGKTTELELPVPGTAVAGRVAPQAPGADAGSFEDLVKNTTGNYIFLFNTRSNAYIDWSNPSDLARSTVVSTIQGRGERGVSSIGHAQVGWVYTDEHGKRVFGAAGQTGQSGPEGQQAVLKGWGLNVLETVFLDGRLESKDDVLATVKKADANGDLSWMAVKTDDATIERLVDFVRKYEQSGAAKNYGFPVDPLKFEGGGCTSFAEAAFHVTGLSLPMFEASKRAVNMPSALIGVLAQPIPNTRPPELAPSSKEEKKVNPLRIVLGKTSWAPESKPHQDFWFYDPELYYESVVNLENAYRSQVQMPTKVPTRTKGLGPDQARVKETSEQWMDRLQQQNVPIKMGTIHHTTGLIVDLSKAPAGRY